MIHKSLLLAALAISSNQADESQPLPADASIAVLGSRITAPAETLRSPLPVDHALPATALDVLRSLPDVRAASAGGTGGTSFVSIRGAEPNFAQILIDGVRVSNPSSSQGGGFDFAQLDPALIDSIAIIPASRSAVHGADALSGVVSVRLTPGVENGRTGGFAASADSEDGYALTGRIGAELGQGNLLLSASLADTGDLTAGSTMERNQGLVRFAQGVGDWSLSSFALFGQSERRGFPESSGGPELAFNRELETRDTRFLTAGLALAGAEAMTVRPSLRIGYYDDTVEADTPAIFPGVFAPVPALTSDTDFSRLEATGDLRFEVSPYIDLVLGASHQRERANSTGTIDVGILLPTAFDIERDQNSLFAEGQWRPSEAVSLSLAARQDWFDEDDEFTLQGSAEYRLPGTGLIAFAGYAKGFRQPSLFALAFPLTANPDLLPERSVSWSGGLVWQGETARVRFSLFRNAYTDLIDFDPVLFTTVNRSETDIEGASISAQGRIGSTIDWSGSLTWLDFDSETPLRSRPDWFGHARIAWQASEAWRLGASADFNSDVLETSIPTGVIELGGHVAVDLFADWRASDTVSVSLALRNAFDADWQDAVGFPAPGRLFRIRTGIAF
ncbi:TonB-dependent receptor [Maricaulis sp.]|uniref:TonB-dependent receptor plug domain-containing protein n=1 Tax=Maricaulis sp. TaxID=1486257 RepID=UPI00261CFE58|nr:TonB-dependent receptor [Maricaulis sp.]